MMMMTTMTMVLLFAAVGGLITSPVLLLQASASPSSSSNDNNESTAEEDQPQQQQDEQQTDEQTKNDEEQQQQQTTESTDNSQSTKDETTTVVTEPATTTKEPIQTTEPIQCPNGYTLNNDNQCEITPLGELEKLVGPPPQCTPDQSSLECLDAVNKSPLDEAGTLPTVPSPSLEPEPEPEPIVGGPDQDCLFNPSLPKCASDNGVCPDGFFQNEDANCVPDHPDGCPEGFHSHEDDETGQCIADSVPCEPGFVRDPDFPTCSQKVRVCVEHPDADVCRDGDNNHNNHNNHNGDHNDDKHRKQRHDHFKKIVHNIDIHKTVINQNDFPDVDIIGLSIKGDSGDAMVCMMNIDDNDVQCQQFGVPNDRINQDIWRIIETDKDKNFDNANTGSDDVDNAIDAIKSQDFSELKDLDNHDFNVDLAATGINPNGEGLLCLVEDQNDQGTALCEPFKVDGGAISGQITEITEID